MLQACLLEVLPRQHGEIQPSQKPDCHQNVGRFLVSTTEICERNVSDDPAGSDCPDCGHHVIMHPLIDEGRCGGCMLDIALEEANNWSKSFSHFPPNDDDPDVIGYALVDDAILPVFRSWGAAQKQKHYLALQNFREYTSSSRDVRDFELRDAIRALRTVVIEHRPDKNDTALQRCTKCSDQWPCVTVRDGVALFGLQV